jgi:hypothetical protein
VTFGANPHTRSRPGPRSSRSPTTSSAPPGRWTTTSGPCCAEASGPSPRQRATVEPAKLGARAIADLRLLRATVDQGDLSDAVARASLVAVLDDVIAGTGQLRSGDGPLAVLLNLRTQDAPPTPAGPSKLTLDLVEREIAAARRF